MTAALTEAVRVRAVALTVLLSALDGFDVLCVTFAAPAFSHDWAVGKAALGGVLAAGLAGMALGAFLLAPLADLIGRKRLVLVSLGLMAIGTLLSSRAGGIGALSGWRLLTGVGIGACVATIVPLSAEFALPKWRSFAVAAMAMGYPAGGLAGGLLAAALLRMADWRAIFVAGAIAAAVLAAAVAALLPESPAFHAARGDRGRGYAGLVRGGQGARALRLAAVGALFTAVIYYMLSWLPQLVADAGYAPATGSLASATLSLAGIVGGLLLGALTPAGRETRVTAATIAALGVAVAVFGFTPHGIPALLTAAAAVGFLIFAASAGFYAVLAGAFDDASRAAGTGFVSGVGRVASAIAPLAAGFMFAQGLDRGWVSAAFGAAAILAGLLLGTTKGQAA